MQLVSVHMLIYELGECDSKNACAFWESSRPCGMQLPDGGHPRVIGHLQLHTRLRICGNAMAWRKCRGCSSAFVVWVAQAAPGSVVMWAVVLCQGWWWCYFKAFHTVFFCPQYFNYLLFASSDINSLEWWHLDPGVYQHHPELFEKAPHPKTNVTLNWVL